MLTPRLVLVACLATCAAVTPAYPQSLASPHVGVFIGGEEAAVSDGRSDGTYVLKVSFGFPISTVERSGRNVSQISGWMDASIGSVPATIAIPVDQIVSGFDKSPTRANTARGFDLLGGIDIRVGQRRGALDRRHRVTSAITLAAGFATPFNIREGVNAFLLTPASAERFAVPARPGNEYKAIAFTQERRAFNFQWYAGWRTKLFRFQSERSVEQSNFPGVLHFQIGQDRLVESEKPFVYRVSGAMPLPLSGLGRAIYVHGRLTGPIGANRPDTVAMSPWSGAVAPDSVYTYQLSNRDRSQHMWAIGASVELLTLLRGAAR